MYERDYQHLFHEGDQSFGSSCIRTILNLESLSIEIVAKYFYGDDRLNE